MAAFQALDQKIAYVLGSDSKLWLESALFGQVPPARSQVDGNVAILVGSANTYP